MAKFRKRPVVIEAFLWTGDKDQIEDPIWIIEAIKSGKVIITTDPLKMQIYNLDGVITASPGDYIIHATEDEIYPCKPDIFEITHELIEEK